ncbi:MAG: DUF3999 family protein [Acidobacteriota bacterium]|nr:DUF3999 family protein [Acidobacteriota bacterium]
MRNILWLVAFVLSGGPSLSYFQYQRPVQLTGAGQHYLVVDESVWKHARSDLGDLRIYAGEMEVPYSLVVERGSRERERTDVPVLQQSTVAGKTQFLIDMSHLAEYDHVDLKLATKNFVAHARVEGQDDPHGWHWASLGDSILYDLSKENLGRNYMLRLPRATYKYLRVTIDGAVKPEDVQGATSEMREEQPALWRQVSSTSKQEQKGKDTVFTFSAAENVPVERVMFVVEPAQPNFRRELEIQNDKGAWLGSGEINRIHMVRGGQKIDSEDQSVDFSDHGRKTGLTTIKVVIHNGDDPPLKLTGASLQQLERRLYFDAPARDQLTLYYGDEKLGPPVYDYAELFQREKAATAAQLGLETSNTAYIGRPDDRPWSERHPVVLWVAIIAAVAVLGGVALRALRTTTA